MEMKDSSMCHSILFTMKWMTIVLDSLLSSGRQYTGRMIMTILLPLCLTDMKILLVITYENIFPSSLHAYCLQLFEEIVTKGNARLCNALIKEC